MILDEITFSEQTSFCRPSMIREILKASVSKKEMISFAGGLPDISLLPLDTLEKALTNAIQSDFAKSLQYGESMGYFELREWIANQYYGYFNEEATSSEILITHGSQQALSLVGNVFLNRDSYVIVESPTYLGALQAFRICTSKIIPVGCDENGMLPDELRNVLEDIRVSDKSTRAQVLFYVNPMHQNPSTTTWSEERLSSIAKILDEYNVLSVEDEAYRLLSFEEEHRRSFTGYRKRKKWAIQIGSFSKMLSPGFRLGWIKAEHALLEQIEKLKQAMDLNSNQLSQLAVVNFFRMESGFRYLFKICEAYKKKSQLFREFASYYLPEFAFPQITGGMFFWVKAPLNDSYPFFELALENGVAVVPGQEFHTSLKQSPYLRMNFTGTKESELEEGFRKLKLTWRQLNA